MNNNICQYSLSEQDSPRSLGGVSCYRPTWNETDHCIWHADTARKPADELAKARGAIPERIDQAIVPKCSLNNSMSFEDCTLYKADFSQSDLRDVNFSNTYLHSADFSGAKMERADFSECYGGYVDFTGSGGRQCEFRNAELPHAAFGRDDSNRPITHGFSDADFSGADLFDSSFTQAIVDNGDFSNCRLIHSKFDETRLEGANFDNADLRDVDFRHARLAGAYFSGNRVSSRTTFGEVCAYERIADTRAKHRSFTEKVRFDAVRLLALICYTPYLRIRKHVPSDSSKRRWRLARRILDIYSNQVLDRQPTPPNYNRGIDRNELVDELPTSESIGEKLFEPIWRFYNRLSPESSFREEDERDLKTAEQTYLLYQSILGSTVHKYDVVSYELREKHSRRKRMWSQGRYWTWFKMSLSRWTIQYGESPWRIIAWSALAVILPALIYPITGLQFSQTNSDMQMVSYSSTEPIGEILSSSFYFSAMTFSTLGYGSMNPVGFAKILASIQSLLSPVAFALIVFVLGRRATR